jgi:hypothetical protein
MDLTEGSETSAKLNLTPGKYPKENIQYLFIYLIRYFVFYKEIRLLGFCSRSLSGFPTNIQDCLVTQSSIASGPNAQNNIRGWALTLQQEAKIQTRNSELQTSGGCAQYHRKADVSTVPPQKPVILHIL